jgi:site-specific DNA-cytosine methylase
MHEAGLTFRLIEACDTEETSEGRHAAAVLRKRFPDCLVLNPEERRANAYPESARVVDVTAQCTQHSGLNTAREPWLTETTMLQPVLERLAQAPQIECVILENVPNFAKALDGQDRSSYSFWVEGLTECGFSEHAYVILPTEAAGDLHHRTRLLSVHTRGSFHPAAALMRLLDVEQESPQPRKKTLAASATFAFTTGLSENRASYKGSVGATFGHLPAYNTNLNLALFVRGSYYKLSPWLATRCSGLPDDYQSVWDFSSRRDRPRKQPLVTSLATALGNMVSPLQARELGYAIA